MTSGEPGKIGRSGVYPGCFAARVRKWLKEREMTFSLLHPSCLRAGKSERRVGQEVDSRQLKVEGAGQRIPARKSEGAPSMRGTEVVFFLK